MRSSHQILLFFDLGTAIEPFEVELSVRLCVSDIAISSSDIYKGLGLLMPRLHLLRSSYDLFVYDFPYDFFGIVGGYKLRRMCLHCLRSPYDFFGDKLGQNLTETLRISYDNRKVIVQSSYYLHDLPL